MKKRVLSAILAGALALAMVACGSSSSSDSSSDTEETTEEAEEEVEEEAEAEEEEAEAAEEEAAEEETEEAASDIDWSGETITIGYVGAETGAYAQYGTPAMQGAKLAIDEINAAGGIYGATLELVDTDDQSDPTECLNSFNSLVAQGIDLVIGSVTSGCTSAITDTANDEGIVLVSPSATADSITTEDDYIFRACSSDSFQGKIAAAYAYQSGYTEVGVIYCSADTYSAGLYDAFAEGCEEYGIEIVATESTAVMEATEFTNQFTAMVESGVDFVYCPYYYNTVGAYIAFQAREAGYEGLIMGADGYDGVLSVVEGLTGKDLTAFNDVIFTNHYDSADDSETVQNFVASYEETYGEDAVSFAALGYDCAIMIATAIENAGAYDADSVREALADGVTTYECVTGTFTLDETGTPVKGSVIMAFISEDGETLTQEMIDKVEELP